MIRSVKDDMRKGYMIPFISIIVPVYNIEKYIKNCVNSILKYRKNNYEIILVDDGAKDRSGEICDSFVAENENIKVIHKKNSGLSDARNVGIRAARGEYILFVDGDDYINGLQIENILDDCLKQGFPDVVFLRGFKVFPSERIEPLEEFLEKNKVVGRDSEEVLSYISKLSKYPASVCTKLISKRVIEENNLYFEYGKKSEDLDWTKKLLFAAKSFGISNIDYYYYRQLREGSISNSLSYENFLDIKEVVENWKKEAELLEDNKRNILLSFSAYEYKILLSFYQLLEPKIRIKEKYWLKENKYLLYYRSDKQSVLIRNALKLGGIELTTKLLRIYLNHRR